MSLTAYESQKERKCETYISAYYSRVGYPWQCIETYFFAVKIWSFM